jgi:hypothetical protein
MCRNKLFIYPKLPKNCPPLIIAHIPWENKETNISKIIFSKKVFLQFVFVKIILEIYFLCKKKYFFSNFFLMEKTFAYFCLFFARNFSMSFGSLFGVAA